MSSGQRVSHLQTAQDGQGTIFGPGPPDHSAQPCPFSKPTRKAHVTSRDVPAVTAAEVFTDGA